MDRVQTANGAVLRRWLMRVLLMTAGVVVGTAVAWILGAGAAQAAQDDSADQREAADTDFFRSLNFTIDDLLSGPGRAVSVSPELTRQPQAQTVDLVSGRPLRSAPSADLVSMDLNRAISSVDIDSEAPKPGESRPSDETAGPLGHGDAVRTGPHTDAAFHTPVDNWTTAATDRRGGSDHDKSPGNLRTAPDSMPLAPLGGHVAPANVGGAAGGAPAPVAADAVMTSLLDRTGVIPGSMALSRSGLAPQLLGAQPGVTPD